MGATFLWLLLYTEEYAQLLADDMDKLKTQTKQHMDV